MELETHASVGTPVLYNEMIDDTRISIILIVS